MVLVLPVLEIVAAVATTTATIAGVDAVHCSCDGRGLCRCTWMVPRLLLPGVMVRALAVVVPVRKRSGAQS